jgi:hypothetical protein
VKVAAGKAFVAANVGVMSSVTNPDGTTTAGEPGAPPVPKMSHKAKTGWIAAGIIIPVVIIVIVVATNGS